MVTVAVVGLLMVGAVWAYYISRAPAGTIILPAGGTYLGPSR